MIDYFNIKFYHSKIYFNNEDNDNIKVGKLNFNDWLIIFKECIKLYHFISDMNLTKRIQHGDILLKNIMFDGKKFYLIDFESVTLIVNTTNITITDPNIEINLENIEHLDMYSVLQIMNYIIMFSMFNSKIFKYLEKNDILESINTGFKQYMFDIEFSDN